jgi:hypothetical protein
MGAMAVAALLFVTVAVATRIQPRGAQRPLDHR